MTADGLVSVIICVRNGAAVITRQLDALQAQRTDDPFEIVVVDNGSRDGTADVVRGWARNTPQLAPVAVRVVDGGGRGHIPRARNRGAAASRGQVLAFCDADDRVATDWLPAIVSALATTDIAGGRLLAELPDGTPRHETFPAGLQRHSHLPFAPSGNVAMRRVVFEAIGGYDESLPSYGYEDVDFSWRAQHLGFRVGSASQAVIHMTLSSATRSVRKRFLLGYGRILIAHRYPDYDHTPYTLSSCVTALTGAVGRAAVGMARGGDRQTLARNVVDRAGRLAGFVRYRLVGSMPEPTLHPARLDA